MMTFDSTTTPERSLLHPRAHHGRLKPVDGLRTVSIMLVVGSHLCFRSALAPYVPHALKMAVYPHGNLGVMIFFFISGFVITRGLIAEQARGAVSMRGFYIRRSLRILPPLLLYIGAVYLFALVGLLDPLGISILYPVAFACNIIECPDVVGHTWSLAYEEQFYLVMPWLFVAVAGRRAVFCAIPLLLIPFLVIFSSYLTIGFLLNVEGLALGVAAATMWDDLRPRFARLPSWSPPTALIALTLLVVIESKIVQWFGPAVMFAVRVVIEQGLIAFVVLSSVDAKGAYRRALEWRPVQILGQASYGIYLWQQFTTGPINGLHSARTCIVLNGAMLVWCVFLFRVFDRRLIDVGKVLTDRYMRRHPTW